MHAVCRGVPRRLGGGVPGLGLSKGAAIVAGRGVQSALTVTGERYSGRHLDSAGFEGADACRDSRRFEVGRRVLGQPEV